MKNLKKIRLKISKLFFSSLNFNAINLLEFGIWNFIFFLGTFSLSFAQFIPEEQDALNRIVKNRIKTEYIYRNGELEYVNQYATNGRKILFEKYGKGGLRLVRSKWELDSLGKRVRGEYFTGDSLTRRHVFIYDLKGNCVEALKNETKEGFLERGYHYSYNKANQLVLEEHVLLDGTVDTRYEYKYNTPGKLTEEFIFKGNETKGKRITFSYYDTGLLKESILYEKDGALTLKYVAEYDIKKNLVKGLSYQFDQMKIRDEQGNLVKGTEYQGEHIIYNTYIAVYDEKNNLSEAKDLDVNGNVKNLRTYRYVYY